MDKIISLIVITSAETVFTIYKNNSNIILYLCIKQGVSNTFLINSLRIAADKNSVLSVNRTDSIFIEHWNL